MDLIDLSTPKPGHGPNTFSPTLLRGLDECFKTNALKFAESDAIKTYKESENTCRQSLGVKRCPTTPLTPSLGNGRTPKRRILADRSVNRSLPLSVNFKDEAKKIMKKGPISTLKQSQITRRRKSRGNIANDEVSSLISEQISLAINPDTERQIQVEMSIVQEQLKHLQEVADFIRLEKKFTSSL